MKSFDEWLEAHQGESLEEIAMTYGAASPSKATKDDIIKYWQSLVPARTVYMTPVSADHKGSTYSQDGIRITGSRQFIDSILARIKDLIYQESADSKLEVAYRQVEGVKQVNDRPDAYVFYCMVRQRAPKKYRMKPGQPAPVDHLEINKQPLIKPAKPPQI